MSGKACKICKRIIAEGTSCPVCKDSELTTNWKGFVMIFDPEHSEIAKKMGISLVGSYALRLGK